MLGDSITILYLAFGLGLLHALDADHIMAVSGLSCTSYNFKRSITFFLRWALGHGGALLLIGFALLGLGISIPAAFSNTAELIVSIILILIGGWILLDLIKKHAHIHFHQHDGLPQHAHWHVHNKATHVTHKNDSHQHEHGAIIVGLLHGIAGSAPLLALIPLAQLESVWLGVAYLGLFCLGVLLAMLLFGGLWSYALSYVSRWENRFIQILRLTVAISAVVVGARLFYGNF